MVSRISSPNTSTAPNAQPAETPAAPAKKTKPGFDAEGVALPDAEVWGAVVGKEKRALNTAEVHGKGQAIDNAEQKALAQLFVKSPREFLSKLRADSMNGTPVGFKLAKELEGFGVLRVDINVDKAAFEAKATVDVYKKTVNGFLGAVMAKKGDQGKKPQIELSAKGKLTKDGVEGAALELALRGIPNLSAEKLTKIDQLKKELGEALKSNVSKAAKEEKVTAIFDELVGNMSELPVPFLVKLVTSSDALSIDLKLESQAAKAHAELGNGNYAITIDDILGQDKGEPDIGAKVAGTATDDGTISIAEARIFLEDKVGVRFDSKDTPHYYKKDSATGKRVEVNDHAAELAMMIPMAIALGAKNIG
ncbi:MAG: hypothetical protein HYV07_23185 [Deltaproteobacteria bacterium]|nr:hypothetical protein [Deltaproteobacteria bacterium]